MALELPLGGAQAPTRPRRLRLGIKRFLPRTLFGRSIVIIVTPLLLMQSIATFVFFDRHWDLMSKRLSESVAAEIAMMLDEIADGRETRAAVFARVEEHTALQTTFHPGETIAPQGEPWGYGILLDRLTQALRRLGLPYSIDPTISSEVVRIQVQQPDGMVQVLVPMRRLFSSSSYLFLSWMIGSAILLFAVALIIMRNQIRPLRRLAAAAERFGKGRDTGDFRIEGASEVRQAARAFLVMRERIQRMIAQRTEMLAGVSHDLRTPLTRMKLELAMLGDGPEVGELQADVAEMERMIEGYLAFARGEGVEGLAPVELKPLLQEIVAAARREGAEITLEVADPITLPLRREAFRRCLGNLLSNARRYGSRAWVRASWAGDHAEVAVEDDGPGVPEPERENVFRPFYRLDPSRNQATGGTGLGLTIARDIARRHGGDIRLGRSPQGGLSAVISLPA